VIQSVWGIVHALSWAETQSPAEAAVMSTYSGTCEDPWHLS